MGVIVSNLRALHNPMSLFGVVLLSLLRGVAYLCMASMSQAHSPMLTSIGAWGLGAAWIIVGLFLFLGMCKPRFLIPAGALTAALYATWTIMFVLDLATLPSWDAAIGMSMCIFMATVTIALVGIELTPPWSSNKQAIE